MRQTEPDPIMCITPATLLQECSGLNRGLLPNSVRWSPPGSTGAPPERLMAPRSSQGSMVQSRTLLLCICAAMAAHLSLMLRVRFHPGRMELAL